MRTEDFPEGVGDLARGGELAGGGDARGGDDATVGDFTGEGDFLGGGEVVDWRSSDLGDVARARGEVGFERG